MLNGTEEGGTYIIIKRIYRILSFDHVCLHDYFTIKHLTQSILSK